MIGPDNKQVGILLIREALALAQDTGLDLVEISPNADPPVCKIVDYGKFRYDQTKKEKESKKAQIQIKIKEIKLKPNIDEHDFMTKCKQARAFIEKGNKVKVTCVFRGREMAYPQLGERIMQRMCDELEDIALIESPIKMMGRSLLCILAPGGTKGKKKEKIQHAKDENQKSDSVPL